MIPRELKPEDYFHKKRTWAENPRQPILLTFEPAGDDESDIAWAVRGRVADLGRYAMCPHLPGALKLLNTSLMVNDGIGRGGEAALHDLNADMAETRYSLGGCAVKAFTPVLAGIVEYQRAQR